MWTLRIGSLFFAVAVIELLFLPGAHSQNNCPLPGASEVETRLLSILIANLGEGGNIQIELIRHSFSCLAVQSRDRFAELSVVATYRLVGTTTSPPRTAQFELRCTSGSWHTEGGLDPNPPEGAFTMTRRDCIGCTGQQGPVEVYDGVTNCIFCPDVCRMQGQGSCIDRSRCCPFFTTDGTCTSMCPGNFSASASTNFTCACNLSCPAGFTASSTCDDCIGTHICAINDPCQNDGTCVIGSNSNNDYTCSCTENFAGRNCEICNISCPAGFVPNSACNGCNGVHICVTNNPCQNGGTCVIGSGGNADYTCSCTNEFSGRNCETCNISCPVGFVPNSACNSCTGVHICVTNNPCQNGGTCVIGSGGNADYTCSCTDEFSGRNCEICNISCPVGFVPNSACNGCTGVHICVTNNPCQNGGTCVIGSGGNDDYTCSCSGEFAGQNCENVPDNNCTINGETVPIGESRVFLELDRNRLYGEFILILDESSSMAREHVLIRQLLRGLDNGLRSFSIGRTVMNKYGLLGFGGYRGEPLARIYTSSGGRQFVSIDEIDSLVDQVEHRGRLEDGYAAIEIAFNNYTFEGGAKQFLLVTDEDRDSLNPLVTRDVIMNMLRGTGTRLNAIVSEEFQAGGVIALGMNKNSDTYVFNPLSSTQFAIKRNGGMVPDSAHGTTHMDYTELVLQTNGAAWGINTITNNLTQLNPGFLHAFAYQKGVEVVEQLIRRCVNCTCIGSGVVCAEVNAEEHDECNITAAVHSVVPPRSAEASEELSINEDYAFVLAGDTKTLQCSTKNHQPANFAWTFKGSVMPDNAAADSSAMQSSLTIENFSPANIGKYTCFAQSMISGADGDITSQLELEPMDDEISDPPPSPIPVISPSPAPPVSRGSNFTITCTTEPTPAVIQWSFEMGSLPSNVFLNRTDDIRLDLTIVNFDFDINTGVYTCTASAGVMTNSTSVLVVPTEPLRLPTISPSSKELGEGENAVLTCTTNIPATITWQYRNSDILPRNVRMVSAGRRMSLLNITNFDESVHAGEYRCIGVLGSVSKSRVVFVSPKDIFRISASPMEINTVSANVSASRPVRFQCRLECSCLGAQVVWREKGSAMVGSPGRTSTLTITEPEFEVTGRHECVGIPPPNSGIQRVMISVQLNIRDVIAPISVMVNIQQQIIEEGAAASVICTSNRPVLRFEWAYLRDDDTNLPEFAIFRNVTSTISELMVTRVTNRNTGVYYCRGIFADTSEVAIERTRLFLPDTLRVSITRPNTLTLRCALGCTCQGAQVRWNKVGSTSLPSSVTESRAITGRISTLRFTRIDASNTGDYRCTATFNSETNSETFTVV